MNLVFIETFVTVALSKNITDSAAKLFTSQSTVSYRLKELERLLDVTLIKRGKGEKATELTNEGKQFLPLALNWLELNKKIKNFRSETDYYSLSIASVESLNMYLLGDFYKNLQFDEHDWRLSIHNLHSHEIARLTNAKVIDIGIIVSDFTDIGVVSEEIYSEEIVVVTKKPGLFPSDSINSTELNEETEIFVDWGYDYNLWRKKFLSEAYVHKWRSDSFSVAYQLLHDDYWFFAPLSVCQQVQQHDALYYHRLRDQAPSRKIHLIYNPAHLSDHPEVIEVFREKLVGYLRGKVAPTPPNS
ncbi:MAG: LysR family transcriptional regulator [Neisseriaceae bacterium]